MNMKNVPSLTNNQSKDKEKEGSRAT